MKINEALKQSKIWAEDACKTEDELKEQKEYVRSRIMSNKSVSEAIYKHTLEQFVYSLVYATRHTSKKKLTKLAVACENPESPPNKPATTTATSRRVLKKLKTRIDKERKTVFDGYDCGGKKIGDCKRAEVLKQAIWHQNNGNGHMQKANLFFATANCMKSETKTVRECVTPQKFTMLIDKYKIISSVA